MSKHLDSNEQTVNPGSRPPLTAREGRQAGPGQEGDLRSVNARPSAGTPSPCALAWAWLKCENSRAGRLQRKSVLREQGLAVPGSRIQARAWAFYVASFGSYFHSSKGSKLQSHWLYLYTFMGDC